MNSSLLRTKRVILPTIAAVAVLGIGGTVWNATAADDDVQGSERDRVGAAAVKAAGGGTAVDVETSDDPGEAYEVEVRLDDGTEVDISLDEDLNVTSRDADDEADHEVGDEAGDDADTDADDRALSDEERASAGRAALAAVGGGTVGEVEAGDDGNEAYEVEVRDSDNAEWDVKLDAGYRVLSKTADD